MTLQPRPAAGGDDSDRPHVEFSRLLCDDGYPGDCQDGVGETYDRLRVDGQAPTGLDAGSVSAKEVVVHFRSRFARICTGSPTVGTSTYRSSTYRSLGILIIFQNTPQEREPLDRSAFTM